MSSSPRRSAVSDPRLPTRPPATEHEGWFTRAISGLEQRPRWVSMLVVAVLFVGVAALDDLTNAELSLSMFHLLPLSLAAWLFGARGGALLAVLAGVAAFSVDKWHHETFIDKLFVYWDAVAQFLFFTVFAFILNELRSSYRRIEDLARRDGLTGLANRGRFFEVAEHELHRAARSHAPLTTVHVDIDNFKQVNDTRGHAEGDRLLAAVGDLMRTLRRTDVPCRLGGDEFVVLMPETDAPSARVAVEKLRAELAATAQRGPWAVTFSLGAATFLTPPAEVETMVHAADEAMYQAKNSGKNRAVYVTFE